MKRNSIGKTLRLLVVLAALLCVVFAGCSLAEKVDQVETAEMTKVRIEDPRGISNAEAAEQYMYQMLGWQEQVKELPPLRRGNTAGNALPAISKKLYDELKVKVQAVASGSQTSTVFSYKLNELFPDGCTGEDLGYTGSGKLSDAIFLNVSSALAALMEDCPYELYWYDKTIGASYSCGGSYSCNTVSNTTTYYFSDNYFLEIRCSVSADYAENGALGTYQTKASFPEKVSKAAANAKKIVADNAGKSDYYKLIAYKEAICSLTEYNHYAANNNIPYGDPWQLIYVFDGEPETTVVCEGYSKAFQYLCDLSTFRSKSTKAISVSGYMWETGDSERGRHMWNIVTLNGNRYLADITNSDDGSVGWDGTLFLTGYAEYNEKDDYYRYDVNKTVNGTDIDIYYSYTRETLSAFSENLDELETAGKPYANIIATGDCSADGEGNHVTWTLYDSGLLTISGTGKIKNYTGAGNSPFYNDYKNKITSVFIGEGVTNIGGYLLYEQEKLEEVSLPDSLEEIGGSAFGNCSGLSEIVIPNGVTSIGYAAFNGCTGLTVVNIPETVTTINPQAFLSCSGLKSIRLPQGLETVYYSTFALCSNLESIMIPDSVKTIGDDAFNSCNSLTDVYYCGTVSQKNLISISGSNDGNNKLQNAVWHCTGTTGTERGGSCGTYAYWFLSANGTNSDVVITGSGKIDDIDFDHDVRAPWAYESTGLLLKSATIENGITVLGEYAFAGCPDLTSVSLPEGLLEIGAYAFDGCTKLTSITIPSTVNAIGLNAFRKCTNLANIWFGGTREAWNSLSQNLSLPDSVTVHCTDDEAAQATWEWEIPIGRPDVLILKGTGKVSLAEGETTYPWSTMIGQIKRVIVEGGITELGPRMLAGCNDGLRVDFLGNSMPIIAGNAFGYNSAVCRHFTSGGNWSTGISNVKSIYLPFQPDAVDALEIRFTTEGEWVVGYRTRSSESSTEVTAEQAMELTFDDRWVVLDTIPTGEDDLDVFMGLDAPTEILFSDSCADAGPAALDFSAQNTDNLKTVETYAKNLKLTITGPEVPEGCKAPNVIVHEGNTFNYNGNINKLTLNTTQHSSPAVTVTGGVKELVFHDASDDRPYKGSLTVSGTIDLVTAHGQDSLFIPGLSANGEDPVPLNNMPLRTYTNVTQADPVVTLFTEDDKTESRLTIIGQEAQVQKWTVEDCRFAYHIYDDRISFDLIPKQPVDAQPIGYIFDILGRGYNPNFTLEDICQGADTTVYVENTGANNENYDPVITLGVEGQANQTGIGTLYLENCRVEINYPVAQVMIWQEASRNGPVFAEINSTVNDMGLLLSRAGGKIQTGENGAINGGYWDRGILGWRIFEKVNAGETLAENGQLCVMSAKSGQTLKAILPSDAAVTGVAAVTADGSTMPANYYAYLDVNQTEISVVTGGDQILLNTYLTENNLTSENVWAVMDVTVNADPVIGEGTTKTVNTLSSGVPVSIENKAGSTATVLRLHDEVLTELPNTSGTDGVYQFTSDQFSTYVLVSTTTCCTHPQTSTRTSWKDGTVITSVNDVVHHVTGIRVIEEYCSNPDCNEVLSTTEEPVDCDFEHNYQPDGDPQTEVTYQWINAEQHKKTTVTITPLECAECGHTMSQRSAPVYDDPEAHTDENEDDFCDKCGISISAPWVADGNWVLDIDDEEGIVLYINGSGKMPDYSAGGAPWNSAVSGKAIDRIVIAEGITRVGANAFANLSGAGNEPVRVEFLDWSETKSRKMPEVSAAAFTGTNVICRYYSLDASWAKGIANRTENWIYLPWYEAQTPGKLPVCYGYVKNTGYTWHIQQESGDIPLTLEQAREITYKYRYLDLFVLPDPQGTDDELYTNSTVPVYLTVNVDEQGTLELNATTGASLNALELMSPNLNVTLTRAEGKLLNYVVVHAGTLTVNGSINLLELTNSVNSAGNVIVNGDVAQLGFDGPQSSEDDIFKGDLTVKGKIIHGYEYGSGKLSIAPLGEIVLTGMVCKTFSLDTDTAMQVVQDGSLVLTGDNVVAYATTLSDYTLTYQFYDDKTMLVLEPKLVGNRCELNLTEKIREIKNDPTADFDPDDIIWGADTEVDVHFWTTPKILTLNGGENGTAGFTRLFINATVGTVNLNCPVGSLTVAHDFYRGVSNALTLNINSTVEDADFAFSGCNNLVTLGAQGKLKGGIWKKFQHARRTIPLVTGSCTLVKDGQLCILAAQENETMKAILPGDSALKRAAGQEAVMSITESGRDLQETEQEALDQIKGEGNTVAQVFDVFVYDGEFNSLNNLNSNARMAVENGSDGSAYVVRFHDYGDGNGLVAERVSPVSAGQELWFESSLFSTYAVVSGTPSACAEGHTLQKVETVPATCIDNGITGHWECSACGKLFADNNGTAGAEITDYQTLIIPATGIHTPIQVAEEPNNCTTDGCRAHWRCSVCGALFFDNNGAAGEATTARLLAIPAAHTLKKVNKVYPTLTEVGCEEHWKCTVCDELFWDENGNAGATLDELTIPVANGKCGENAYWSLRDGTLTIWGTGEMYVYDSGLYLAPWYGDKEQIETVIIESGITSLGESAFSDCSAMTAITLPEGITGIGYRSFINCSSLTSVIIPDSVTSIEGYAFENCSSLTGVTIGDGVTSIGGNAFSGCNSLTSVTIPDNVTSIGGNAFWGCSNLTSITIPDSVTSIGGHAFAGCILSEIHIDSIESWLAIDYENDDSHPNNHSGSDYRLFIGETEVTSVTVPDSVTSIGNNAFYGFSSLTGVTIGDNVTSIGDAAFAGCSGLTNVTIPDSVTSLGNYVFYDCSNLTNITISDSVPGIGNYTFYGCDSLTAVTIPDSVTSVGNYAFNDCSSLTSVTIGDGVTSIGENAFCNCSSLTSVTIPDGVTSIGNSVFMFCSSLTDVTIPDSVTSIGKNAFSGCSSLMDVTIPDSVTSIGENAFSGCSGLTSVTIPDSVTSISNFAFAGCNGLTSVTIGENVTSIGDSAFDRCYNLMSVTIPNSVTSIGSRAFYLCTSLTSITIPEGVTSIEDEAFYDCNSLTKMVIPESVHTFGSNIVNSNPTIYCYRSSDADNWADEEMLARVYLDEIDPADARELTLEPAFRLALGDVRPLIFNVFPSYDNPNVTWVSNNPSVLTVEDDGTVTGLSTGSATVTAACDEASASVVITVYKAATDYDLTPAETWLLAKTETCQLLPVNIEPIDAEISLTYESSDSNLATVDSDGLVKTFKPGDVTITAVSERGIKRTAVLHLFRPVSAVDLTAPQTKLITGSDMQLTAHVACGQQSCENHFVTFTSSDTTVATVDSETGVVHGIATGVVTITATASDQIFDSVEIQVMDKCDEHTPVTDEAVAPTCTEPGLTEGSHCAVCGEILVAQDTVDALGHNWGEPVYTWENNYSTATATHICSICEHVDTETVDATSTVTAAATCEGTGETTYTATFTNTAFAEQTESVVTAALGHDLQAVPEVPANCTTAGTAAHWKCSRCNQLFSDAEGQNKIDTAAVIPALGHDLIHHDAKAATCTAIGWDAYDTCSRCDYTTYEEILALGHDLIHHDAKAATCTEVGWDAYDTCSRCDYTTYEEIPALGHDLIHHDAKAATCTEVGWDAYDTCSRCDYTTYEEIPALGHDLIHHDAKAATCTEDGWEAYDTCSRCDYTTYEKIDRLGHDLVHHDAKAPTCTEPGWNAYDTCSRCDHTTKAEIPALGHDYVDHAAQKPTCTGIGWDAYRTCSRCDYTTYEEIPARGHDLIHHDAKAATCTEDGWEAYDTCSRCDYTTYEKIDRLGHDLVHHDAKAPTCTAIGWEAYDTCSRCDYTTKVEIPALDHDLVHHNAQDPTCTEVGWEAYDTCSRCDYTSYVEIPALGHDWHAEYIWANDYSQCTATVVCQRNTAHQNTKTVDAQSTVSTEPTCEGKGKTTYTATFTIEGAEEQTVTLENIDPLDHDWGGPVYTWSADNRTVTAAIVCKRDQSHRKESETVSVTARVSKAATCTEKGQTTYTSAAFQHPEYIVQTKTLTDVPALGHQLTAHGRVEPTYDSTGTEAYWECARCHKLFADAAGTREISAPVVIAKLVRPAEPAPAPAPAPTEPPEPADKVEAFVTRCYRVILGREPDAKGLAYWVDSLKSGKEKASEIINGFVTSNEFVNRHYSDETAVEILYKAMLGRSPDEGGKNYWLSVLNGGNPFAAVINGFCTSNEFKNLCANYGIQPGSVEAGPMKPPKPVKDMTKIRAFVTRCYKVILSRDPDPTGLEYWAKALANGDKEAAEIIDGFVNSNEYRAKQLGHADSVEVLYNAMLGRGSDAGGKAYWVSELQAGNPFAVIINGFCTSNEFKDLCNQYGITPGSVKVPDKVKGTFTAATSKTGTERETKQMNEAKLKDFVRRAYAAALGREPGDTEAEHWVWQLRELRIAPAEAARGILTSEEFRSRGIGGEQLIRILYRIYMNRDADEAGLAFWLAKLEAGASPEELMDDFAASAEFKNILRTFWE